MRFTQRVCAYSVLASAIFAQAGSMKPETLPLWPNAAPGEKGDIGPEKNMTTPKDNVVSGKPVVRLGNISTPTLTVYKPPKSQDTGAAVVVFPGGGYRILAMDLEGTEVCEWLNSIGVTGILVKYRVPAREGGPRYAAPLQDAQRAIGIIRQNASKWGIDPAKIGVLGFSAGGHLAAAASNNFDQRTYEPVDEADTLSSRPDFTILVYPAYLTSREEPHKTAPELPVSPNTPPTFIVQTEDDNIPVENSLFYYAALKKAKVPAELHVYSTGGHGYGLRPSKNSVSSWPKRAEEWMRSIGMIGN